MWSYICPSTIKQSYGYFDITFLHLHRSFWVSWIYIPLSFLDLLIPFSNWKAPSLLLYTLGLEIKVGLIYPNMQSECLAWITYQGMGLTQETGNKGWSTLSFFVCFCTNQRVGETLHKLNVYVWVCRLFWGVCRRQSISQVLRIEDLVQNGNRRRRNKRKDGLRCPTSRGIPKLMTIFVWCRTFYQICFGYFSQYKKSL